jgi:hypothetical protein
MNPCTPVMLDDVEIDAVRIGLALLDDEVQGGVMSPCPKTTPLRRSPGRGTTYTEDHAAAVHLKSQRLAIARLSKKLRAVA